MNPEVQSFGVFCYATAGCVVDFNLRLDGALGFSAYWFKPEIWILRM